MIVATNAIVHFNGRMHCVVLLPCNTPFCSYPPQYEDNAYRMANNYRKDKYVKAKSTHGWVTESFARRHNLEVV